MSVSQILGVASLYSFITVKIITNCQTYDHQWMHNVWSIFRSDNDDWIISDIFINLTSKSHHLSHHCLQIGFDTSLNHICTESTSWELRFTFTRCITTDRLPVQKHNYFEYWLMHDHLKAYGPQIQLCTIKLSSNDISDNSNRVEACKEKTKLK